MFLILLLVVYTMAQNPLYLFEKVPLKELINESVNVSYTITSCLHNGSKSG